jgi:hypothetical protein
MALPILVSMEIVKQLFKFGGSFRKEAISAGTVAPALISVINTYTEAQSLASVSGEQWTFLIGSLMALYIHLNAKAKEASA